MWENKTDRLIGETIIHLVSVEHLIELKKYANRIQDQHDILLLSKLLKNGH